MGSNGGKSCLIRFLEVIDLFSYIPVPQAYPVSTNKSKIGSIIFICGIIGYLIFDMYNFVTSNIPIVNAYKVNQIDKGPIPVPKIAFGMYLKQINSSTGKNQYSIFNDSSYFSYKFQSYVNTLFPNGSTSTIQTTQIPLVPCLNYPIFSNLTQSKYLNLTCIDIYSSQIIGLNSTYPVINQNGALLVQQTLKGNIVYRYYFRLYLYVCGSINTTSPQQCASSTDIENVLKNSLFYLLGFQHADYDFKSGQLLGRDNFVLYKFTVVANSTTNSDLYVFGTQFQKYPNFLTQFSIQKQRYSRFDRSSTSTPTTSSAQAYRVRILPQWSMNTVQIHPQTLIAKLSEWSAFVGLLLFIGGICFFGYNKNKFIKSNPDWQRFDQTLKEKVYIQLQQINSKRESVSQKSQLHNQNNITTDVKDKDGPSQPQPNYINNNDIEDSVDLDEFSVTRIRQKMMQNNAKQNSK